MSYASNKRKTQINFNVVGLNSHRETDALVKPPDEAVGEKYNLSDRIHANQVTGKNVTGKRSLPPEGDGVENTTSLKPLKLPKVINSGSRARVSLKLTHASPWEIYEKSHDVRLGVDNYVTVAERMRVQPKVFTRTGPLSNLVLVKTFSGVNVEDKLRKFEQIQHINVVTALEVFRSEETCYVVFEYMAYSLYYVAGNPRLNEIRLAAIVGQILNGLAYLELEGLVHSSLTCSNILIHPCGDVKIASQECCESRPHGGAEHTKALSNIVMELIQGYGKEDGAIGVEDLDRWPSDSNAVDFLSATVTAASLAELIEHPLLRLPWRKETLQGLVSFVTIATHIGRRYPPK